MVTNPPFVVSPGTGELLVYRDSGLPGDEMVRRVVTGLPDVLAPGGVGQVLANWAHVDGEPWEERLRHWLEGTGCEAWVVQREVADPAQYVELWLRDAGHDRSPDYLDRYDAWMGWFEEQGITGIGFGWINLRRTDAASPSVTVEEWPYEVEQPLGPEVEAWMERTERLASPRRRRPARHRVAGQARRTAGDGGCARRRGPRGDRAAPAARDAPGPSGRHRRGRTGRCQ